MNKSKFFSIIFSLFDIRLNNFHSINNKKAIGPVVATALLLVVAVVAVVGFQSWFSSYLSGVFSDIEIQSNSELDGSLKIESLIGDILYIINNIQDNLSIGELKIGGNLCTVTNNLTLGMNEVPVSSCISNLTTSTPDIVLITEKNVVSKTVYVKDSVSSSSSSLDCSTLNGGEWILVPGNAALGTSDFCVMKYEAKATTASEVNLFSSASMYCGDGTDGGGNNCLTDGSVNVTSKAASKPLTQVYQTEARQLCANLGVNYRLITDAEWVTIARNAENVSSNWADNTIGSTVASGGGLKRGNVGITDGASYNAASNPADRSLDTNSLAMFTLSNGETIWDLSGNVWEWTDDTFNTNAESALGQATSNWYEWTAISGHDNLEPFSSSLDANYGVGKVYTDVDNAYPSGTVHGFLRGGGWADGPNAGAFALALGTAPSGWSNGFGFRCSYAP